MTEYFITKGKQYITNVEITGNGFVVYNLDQDENNMQLFTELEKDMFLALIKRSTILTEKQKRNYKAHQRLSDITLEALRQAWKVALERR